MDSPFNIDPNNFGFNYAAPNDPTQIIERGNQPPATIDKKTLEEPFSGISNTFQRMYNESEPTPTITTTYPKELTEKYKGTSAYSPWMDPYADNEKIAAENFSRWDAISSGLSGLLDNAAISGKEYANTFLRTGRAFLSLNADYLGGPSESDRMKIAFDQEQVRLDNPIYYSPGTENDIFSKQFLAEALQNTGFTFGTLGAFAVETAATGGIGKLAGFLPKLFKAGATAKSIELSKIALTSTNAIAKEQQLAEAVANIGKQISGKDLYNNALNVAGKLPFVGQFADAAKIMRAGNTIGLTTKELATIGAGGLKRAFSEWNFAASEAAIEAGGTYGEIYDSLVKLHIEQNGIEPTGAELDRIRADAMRGSTQGYATNLAILGISNKIQFGNLFRKFGVDGKFLNLFKNESSRVFAMMGKDQGGKFLTKNYSRKLLGAVGHYGDIVKNFGKSAFARQFGADLARGLTKFELLEGIQENLQEGTNEFLKDYYTDLYDDDIASWSDSFNEAVESQSWFGDGAGFKTFLQGALTGFFIAPITGVVSGAIDAYNTKRNPNHNTALEETLKSLNTFYQNPDDVLKESIKSIKQQAEYNSEMVNAAANNQKYEYFNNKDSSLIKLALQAKRTGTFDAFKTYMTSLGDNMDATEFKEATGLDVEDIKQSPSSYMNNLVGQIDQYGKIYDKYNMMFGDYLTMDVVSKDPYRSMKFSVAQAAMRDAIQTVAFNESKSKDSTIRAKSIAQNISNIESIGQSAASTFNTIIDYDKISEQAIILESEIKLLEEGENNTPATKTLIKDKKKELELIKKWGENFYTPIVTADKGVSYQPIDVKRLAKEKRNMLTQTLADYYTVKNKQLNLLNPVTASDINTVLQDINDYQKLDRDSREYIEAVNILTDPENAINSIQKYADARVAAYARHAHKTYTKLADISQIFKDYVDKEPQELDDLLNIARSSQASIDSIDKVRGHLENLTKMRSEKLTDDQQKTEELTKKAIAERNAELAKYADLSSMTTAEVDMWLSTHYLHNGLDEDVEGIDRYYTDLDGNRHILKSWELDDLDEYIKDTYGISNIDGLIDSQYFMYFDLFLKDMEQAGYYAQEGISPMRINTIVSQDDLIYQIKKIKKLVGQKVIRNGLPGIIAIEDDEFIINHVDGTTTVLGPYKVDDTSFEWVYDEIEQTYRLNEVTDDPDITIDDYSEITLVPDNQTLTFQNMSGLTGTSINVRIAGRAHQIELIDDNLVKIDGIEYNITRDDQTNQVETLISTADGKVIEFSATRAMKSPKSLDAKYIALLNTFLLMKKPVSELTDADLDIIINSLSAKTSSPIIRPAGIAVFDATEQSSDLIMNRGLTPTLADIFDRYLIDADTVNDADKQKLYNWATDTIEKLTNLDAKHPVVQEYVQLINDLVINPLYKSNGFTNSRKQSKKSASKKAKTPQTSKPPSTRPDQPSAPGADGSSTPEDTKEFIDQQYDNLAKQKARKIDEFFKSATQGETKFTRSDKKAAVQAAKINKSTYDQAISATVTTSPFADPDIIQNLNTCNS